MSLLTVRHLSAFYGSFQALFDVSLEAEEGETVAVIGANGAGKTTFLRSVAGVLPVPAAAVSFGGDAVGGRPAHELAERGIVMCPRGGASSRA
jgi:branched-chain amino acid transport system ATP-binding protein